MAQQDFFPQRPELTPQDGEAWLLGTDVARRLKYTNPPKALRDHVDDEDKLTERIVLSGQHREIIVINESVEKHESALRRTKKERVLDRLPLVFTNREFEEAMCEIGGEKSSCPTYLTRMVNGGLIIRENVGVYRKICQFDNLTTFFLTNEPTEGWLVYKI